MEDIEKDMDHLSNPALLNKAPILSVISVSSERAPGTPERRHLLIGKRKKSFGDQQ